MFHDSDAPADSDPLSEFAIEPELPPHPAQLAAAMEVAPTQPRVDRLEQAVERSISDLLLLRAEVATLVASIDDIKKSESRRATPPERSSIPFAVAGMFAGILVAVFGWMAWSDATVVSGAAAAVPPAPIELPITREAEPVVPAIVLASAAPAEPQTPRAEPEIKRLPARVAARIAPVETEYIGTLSIDATPAGAQVFVNRRAIGTVPQRVENLKAGSHLVWIERDGYRRFTQVVQVRSDRVSRVSASLQPIAAP